MSRSPSHYVVVPLAQRPAVAVPVQPQPVQYAVPVQPAAQYVTVYVPKPEDVVSAVPVPDS